MKLHNPESTPDLTKKMLGCVYLPFPLMLQPKNLIVSSQIITFPFLKKLLGFYEADIGYLHGIIYTTGA